MTMGIQSGSERTRHEYFNRRDTNEEIVRENREQFRVAREIQQRLFPKTAPAVPPFDIAGASFPADDAQAHYLLHVMRAKPGMRVSLFNSKPTAVISILASKIFTARSVCAMCVSGMTCR